MSKGKVRRPPQFVCICKLVRRTNKDSSSCNSI